MNPLGNQILAITRSNELFVLQRENKSVRSFGRLYTSPATSKGLQCGFITESIGYTIERRGRFKREYVLNVLDFRLEGRAFEQAISIMQLRRRDES